MQQLSTVTIQEVLPTPDEFYDQVYADTIPDVLVLVGIMAVITGFFIWVRSVT